MRMDETVGTMTYDGLFYDSKHSPDVSAVTIRAGEGVLKRGTVLAVSSGTGGDGKFVILGTAAVADEVLTASHILADETDATTEIVTSAYRSGHFNRNALTVKEAYELSVEDEKNMRDGGIFLSTSVSY